MPAAQRRSRPRSKRSGHSVWWDRHIHGGAEYNNAIEDAVERSDAVVVLWSANSVRSAWVRDEAAEGRDAGKLVPVLIDAVKPPMGFRQYQTIDLTAWTGGKRIVRLPELLNAIDKVAKIAPAAVAAAQAPACRRARNRKSAAAPANGISRRIMLGRRRGRGSRCGCAGECGGPAASASIRVSRRSSRGRKKRFAIKPVDAADRRTFSNRRSPCGRRSAEALGLLALVKSLLAQDSATGAQRWFPTLREPRSERLRSILGSPNALLAMFELQGSTLDWFTRDQKTAANHRHRP